MRAATQQRESRLHQVQRTAESSSGYLLQTIAHHRFADCRRQRLAGHWRGGQSRGPSRHFALPRSTMSRILVLQHVAAEPLGTLDPLI
ncbi:MAG: hypothetical protein WCY72_12600, partial [Lysobacteraceae bacterium]